MEIVNSDITPKPSDKKDRRAIELLISAKVLAPAARDMTIADLTYQHNQANAYGPADAGFINKNLPLLAQVDRIIVAANNR